MVHGGYGTIRLSIPVKENTLISGSNDIDFRFNYSDGISIGYRIIELNFIDKQGNNIWNDSHFRKDDPKDWEPPIEDDAAIEEGKDLWYNGQLISSNLDTPGKWYAYSLKPNTPIKATCSDCHAQDGRDLELFAYSSHSIVERSKFHGLTEEQGKKIASYIRSLSKNKNINRHGRPWNPPYQPGKELANKPIEYWAAGAGLEAVLEDDSDMLIGMFGSKENISRDMIKQYFDSDKMWDTSTQALAIQLPDWKHWLPLIHPKDAFARDNFYSESQLEFDPEEGYKKIRTYLENANGNFSSDQLFSELHAFWQQFRQFFAQGSSDKQHWRTPDGSPLRLGLADGVSAELAATSLAKLLAVKFFEIHQEFQLEGIAPQLIDNSEQPRKRQWLGRQYNVFEVPAHFTACFKTGSERCHNFQGQPRSTGEYESTAWYQLQQVINPGIATSRDVVPVDYNYQPTLILRASSTSQIKELIRFYYSSNVMYQTRTRVSRFTPNDKEGFNMRTMGPWLFFGSDNRNNFEGLEPGEIPSLLDNIQSGLGLMVVEAQIEQFLKEMGKERNNVENWNRRESNNSGEHKHLDPINLTDSDMPNLNSVFSGELRHYAQKIFWVIPRFIDFGVNCQLVNQLKAWGKSAWPRITWEQFTCPE